MHAGALESKGAPRWRRWLDSRTVTSNLEALLAHLMRMSHFGLNLWHRPEHSKHSKRRSLCVVLRVRVALLVFPDLTFCANFFHALFGIFSLLFGSGSNEPLSSNRADACRERGSPGAIKRRPSYHQRSSSDRGNRVATRASELAFSSSVKRPNPFPVRESN